MFRGSTGAFLLTVSLVEAEATSFQGLGDTGISGGLDDAIGAEELVVEAKTSVVESEVVMYLCSQLELRLRIVVVTVTDGC